MAERNAWVERINTSTEDAVTAILNSIAGMVERYNTELIESLSPEAQAEANDTYQAEIDIAIKTD